MSRAASQAVLYSRVSSKEQEQEGYSISAQEKLLRDYASRNSMTIPVEFQDIETAKQSGRPRFEEMLRFLRKSKDCRVLLVEKTDRLYRNIKDWVTLDELDLEIHFVKEGFVYSRTSKSSEKFIHGIKVLMAKNYVDNLSEEASKGMREKAAQGIWPSQAPLGYMNVTRPDKRKYIEPDPKLGPLVRRLFERYATGRFSLKEVTQWINAEGFAFRKSGAKIPKSTVHNVLSNPIYYGEFPWKGRTYQGIHEPLVTREHFDKVQEVLGVKSATGSKVRSKYRWAFQGLITCGHCGCRFVAEKKKEQYIYYHCTQGRGECPAEWVREEVLDQQFQVIIAGITIDREVADWLVRALKESHQDEERYHQETVAKLQGEYARLQNRLDRMYEDRLDGKIDEDFYETKSREWRQEQERVLKLIESHQDANRSYLDEGVRILELAKQASSLYSKQPMLERRRLLDFVLSNSIWKDGTLSPEYRKPFDILASGKRAAEGKDSEKALNENWLPLLDSNQQPSG